MPAWDEFKRVIRDAFASDWDGSQAAIDILEENITLNPTDPSDLLDLAKGNLRFLRRIKQGTADETHQLRMHCEAVFAALLEARNRSASTTNPEVVTLAEKFAVRGLVSQ